MHYQLWLLCGRILLVVAVLSFSLSVVSANERSQLSIEKMAHVSDVVVVAEVLLNTSHLAQGKIYTVSEINVLQSWKGEDVPYLSRVVFLGGTMGEINLSVTEETTLREGEIAVLFLKKPCPEAMSRPTWLQFVSEQGKITLLEPGESRSRLKNNRCLAKLIQELEVRVRKGGTE